MSDLFLGGNHLQQFVLLKGYDEQELFALCKVLLFFQSSKIK